VKPAPFDYVVPTSVADAVTALAADDDAKVIAGGQSLAPLLALRLARPTMLVDVGRLPLAGIAVDGDVLEVGALVRHRVLETDPLLAQEAPLLPVAARHIGHVAIRNRGTLGGSVAHADPAAELPAVLVALDAEVVVQGSGGVRTVRAVDLFEGFFSTALAPDELIVAVRVPRATAGDACAFDEWAPRHGDFAAAGIAMVGTFDDGVCTNVRAAALGVGAVPVDLSAVLSGSGIVGAPAATATLVRAVAAAVRTECTGEGDRAELAGLLAGRAVMAMFGRAPTAQAGA
jgi:aerobic carbon-monoxide dehydrogenase medium subunit